MAALNVQSVVTGGLAIATTAAAAGGDTVQLSPINDDRATLQVTNGGASPITVTLVDPGTTPAGNTTTAPAVSVAASATKLFPLNPNLVNPSTGFINITYSAVTSVTVAAFRR